MKRGTPEHPKTMDLAESLHCRFAEQGHNMSLAMCQTVAIGILERLFHFTARYAPAGDIGKHSNLRIADALGWSHDAAWLIQALSKKHLDETVSGVRLYVHDWHDHSDDAADKWLHDKNLTYANGALPRRGKKSRPSLDAVATQSRQSYTEPEPFSEPKPEPEPNSNTPANAVCVPSNGHAPESSETNAPHPDPSDATNATPSKASYTHAFERWYATYPRKVAKREAAAAFGRALARIAASRSITRDESLVSLIEVTQRFANSAAGRAGQFTPHPATWLNDGRYDDDPEEWNRERTSAGTTTRVGRGQRYRGD